MLPVVLELVLVFVVVMRLRGHTGPDTATPQTTGIGGTCICRSAPLPLALLATPLLLPLPPLKLKLPPP
jgi:hypothetical protein